MARWLRSSFLVVVVSLPLAAAARQVDVPLSFDHDFIRQALVAQVYTGSDGRAVLWDDGTGCGHLKLWDPVVDARDYRVRIVTQGEARAGTPVGGQCLAPLQWRGFLEVFEEPQISADQRTLHFRVVESNIYDSEWKKGFLTGKIWDLVKQYVQPSFEGVRIDLQPATQDLRDVLPLIVARGDAERIQQMVESLRITNAAVTDTGVKVTLAFAVSEMPPTTGPTPEPTLTSEELRRWEEALERWDGFLTFVIKQFGQDASAQDIRQAFGDVLIDSRYDLLEALAPSAPGAPDPTRALFLKAWERLAPVIKRSAATLPGTTALRYMSFIAAADALAALDEVGSEIGLDISADGLRRLARIIAPATAEDPVAYNTEVDPDLRQLLGFGPPLPPPDLSAEPTEDTNDQAWWRNWLASRRAFAAAEQPSSKALEQWIPPDADAIDPYLQAVREVLSEATQKARGSTNLQTHHSELFQRLVLATAWQESCWRQFVRSGRKVTYVRSAIGSSGIMQVNERVWRGVYDLRGLRWDIRYNARAGSEILLRYLTSYAIPQESRQTGVSDFLARATYAVYNGGPGHLLRVVKKGTRKSLQRIDELFLQKIKAVTANNLSDLAHCIVGG